VCNRLQTIMRVQLLIDVVQMVPQSLQRDPQLARNFRRILAHRKQLQDFPFVFGKRETGASRPATSGTLANCREICVILRRSSRSFSCRDVVSKVHDQTPMVPGAFIYQGRHAYPHPASGTDFYFQIIVWYVDVSRSTVQMLQLSPHTWCPKRCALQKAWPLFR